MKSPGIDDRLRQAALGQHRPQHPLARRVGQRPRLALEIARSAGSRSPAPAPPPARCRCAARTFSRSNTAPSGSPPAAVVADSRHRSARPDRARRASVSRLDVLGKGDDRIGVEARAYRSAAARPCCSRGRVLNSSVAKPSACSAVVSASISWLSQGLQTSGTITPDEVRAPRGQRPRRPVGRVVQLPRDLQDARALLRPDRGVRVEGARHRDARDLGRPGDHRRPSPAGSTRRCSAHRRLRHHK